MNEIVIKLLPLLAVLGAAVVILLLSAWRRGINGEFLLLISVAGLAASIWYSWQDWMEGSSFHAQFFQEMLLFDKLALIGFIFFAVSSALAAISSYNYILERGLPLGEYLSLLLFAVFGAGVMASGANLIVIFIGLEILSLSAYVLAGYSPGDEKGREASIKYFILGAAASAILLFGIAFYYGAIGSLNLIDVAAKFTLPDVSRASSAATILLLSAGLIIAGFGFKISAVPFQWWTPDVYQGSPLPVTTFFATTVKTAAFIAFFRIAGSFCNLPGVDFAPLVSAIAVATMTFGNLAALFQEDIKRMLAYSSIAHAGYILLAFVFIKEDPAGSYSSMLFYLLAYIVMTAGAFTVLTFLSTTSVAAKPCPEPCRGVALPSRASAFGGSSAATSEYTSLATVSGIGKTNPWLALVFTLFLLSLAGFPPTAGFFAKFYLFRGALINGHTLLVIIAVLNSLVSVYYYMRPVVAIYFGGELLPASARGGCTFGASDLSAGSESRLHYSTIGVIIFCAIAVVLFGLLPSTVLMILQG